MAGSPSHWIHFNSQSCCCYAPVLYSLPLSPKQPQPNILHIPEHIPLPIFTRSLQTHQMGRLWSPIYWTTNKNGKKRSGCGTNSGRVIVKHAYARLLLLSRTRILRGKAKYAIQSISVAVELKHWWDLATMHLHSRDWHKVILNCQCAVL